MIADSLLEQLQGVRQTGRDRWIARCPAHDDKSPSLAIRESDDRVLIHCFAGCDVSDIVSSVGLELSDLFPANPDLIKGGRKLSKPFPAADILKCLAGESVFLLVCAKDMIAGQPLCKEDCDRLVIAASRIHAAARAGGLQ